MSFNSPHADLLFKATQVPSLASVLSGLASAQEDKVGPIQLTSVTQAAWPFLGAALSISLQPARSIWFICDDAKKQEDFFCELRLWLEPKEMAFFPDLGMTAEGLGLPDPEVLSERLAFLGRLAAGEMLVAVISISALSQRVLSKNDLTAGCWTIDVGWKGSPGQLAQQLYHSHFTRTDSVASRGECALRGGILDFFSWQEELPCRVEFDEEKIISMRYFDSDTQISTQEIQTCTIQSSESEREPLPFIDYIAANDLIVILGDHFNEEAKKQIDQLAAQKIHFLDYSAVEVENQSRSGKRDLKTSTGHLNYHRQMIEVSCYPIPFAQFGAGDFVMQEARRKQFFDQLGAWQKANQHILFFSNTESEGERFVQLVCENKEIPLFNHSFLEMRLGGIAKGFSFPEAQLSILAHAEIFGCSALHQAQRWHRRREEQRAARSAINFSEFEEGDFVVHTEYGIAFYQGLQRFSAADGTIEEVLVLEFQDEAKLFVPLDQAWQVSRYVGIGKATPSLSSLNDERWGKTRALTEKSVFLYAGKLLKLQAERETQKGYAFGPDTPWQKELEQNFPFSETLDQLRAISEIKQDMESSLPMDRLLCGDVGFGKTEVALRAVFKAVMAGKQAIFLAPTTVLAQQHYQTLAQRMSPYPLKIELMSRYRTAAEQRKVIQGLADGTVDIVIGTHRLFSSDIIFKNLGLVVVDEEQRFGVKHKEAFKDRFRLIDMLTLSATPIPRTLYLSLMGARKMSLLETPPAQRQSVETIVCAYDERLIREACAQELARGGQVYFLHNRVSTIENIAARLQKLLPQARITIGHGQMAEKELELVMEGFVRHEIDILVSTTIIESGLDIPNANTIIIDRADRFGLADLYQLRGRVGRSHQKAYAYLMMPRSLMLVGEARRRVQAIKQYTELGSGFKIAMRDLEIRGAGNLLGTAQSGHITAVGFDLYCKMLNKAVMQLHGETSQQGLPETTLLLDFVCHSSSSWVHAESELAAKTQKEEAVFYQRMLPAFIPEDYLQEASLRIEAYRQLAIAPDLEALKKLEGQWRDRFGPLPVALQHLLLIEKIRRSAAEHQVTRVETRENKLMMTRRGDFLLLGHQFPRLTSLRPDSKLSEILVFLDSLK